MSSNLNAFLAGRCYEKMCRILRVIAKEYKSGNDIHFAIRLPLESYEVDVNEIKDVFQEIFNKYDIIDRYTSMICIKQVDYALDVVIRLHDKEDWT